MPYHSSSQKVAVIAIGGNALVPDNSALSVLSQQKNAALIASHIADMIEEGWKVVITHGNGPHVGAILRKNELTSDLFPSSPVDTIVGETQGLIGYILQQSIGNELSRRKLHQTSLVSVVTQVVVSADDPAFSDPDKPIGQFMGEEEAQKMAASLNWTVKEDSGRGWRRVIASPAPQDIVETNGIRSLIDAGNLVITCGGGGIPVLRDDKGLLSGVEAVIDKDRVSAVLAAQLKADMLLIPTGVEQVAINFGMPDQKWLENLSVKEAMQYAAEGHFGAGSMGPKIEAVLNYLAQCPEGCGIITSLDAVQRALRGETGTRISAA